MPWCDDCSRFYNADSLSDTGACPTCGARLERPGPADKSEESEGRVVPWHFWVLVVALVIYLGWRLIQGIGWVSRHV